MPPTISQQVKTIRNKYSLKHCTFHIKKKKECCTSFFLFYAAGNFTSKIQYGFRNQDQVADFIILIKIVIVYIFILEIDVHGSGTTIIL